MNAYVPRLLEKYKSTIVPTLMRDLGLANRLEVPRLDKVTINMGLGEATQNPKLLESAAAELTLMGMNAT